MNPERWRRVLEIFQAALVLPEEERDEFVRSRAGGDAELGDEVLRMLRVGSLESAFLEPADPLVDLPRRLGDFELVEEIGRGGMGVVYRARQLSLEREVAVKVLPPSLAVGERRIDRFRREARAVGRLQHPGIVQVLTVGRDADTDYFAMELVAGHDLAFELARLRADRGRTDTRTSRLPSSHSSDYLRTVARLVLQAADALQHAHDHGVIHRDVKPSNLLLDANGAIKVVDFGLARDESMGALSRSGEFAGTPYYMSPEQVRARRSLVDHRTDVYSLGVVLYELLTLQRPFEGRSSQEVMAKIVEREPERVRRLNARVSRDMATICETAMSKDLSRRYASAGALRDDLQRFLDHQAIQARPLGPARRALRALQRHRRALAAAALVLAALVVGGWWAAEAQAREALEQSERAIAELTGAAPLEEFLPEQLLELRRHLALVAADSAGRARHADLLDRMDALRRDLRERGLAAIGRARDPAQSEGAREASQLEGLQTLMHASLVFPEDEELRRLAAVENTYPRLDVQVLGGPARVLLREIDPWTSGVGPRRDLGPAPIEGLALLPGVYRVVIAYEGGGLREELVQPGPANMDVRLVLGPAPDESEVTRGMVRLPAARYTFADYDGERQGYQGRTVDLEAFWIDRTEVSNADYARFVRATGRAEPLLWEQGGGLEQVVERHGDLPVIGVSWADAAAYAAWSGKRLPTSAEWHYAAGGLENRAWPWSADPSSEMRGNVRAEHERLFLDPDTWDEYVRKAQPIDSSPDAATPEGVQNLFGNVDEWTESIALVRLDGSRARPEPFARFVWGGAWDVVDTKRTHRSPAVLDIGPGYLSHQTGFRCARSAAP